MPVTGICFTEPEQAIRAVADTVGRESRRMLLAEVVGAWVDEIPEQELDQHYSKALADLEPDDLALLAAWHSTMDVGTPLPSRDFLCGVFGALGDQRREALRVAAGFRGDEAFAAGVGEEQALDVVLPWLSEERLEQLATAALEIYVMDRIGSEN